MHVFHIPDSNTQDFIEVCTTTGGKEYGITFLSSNTQDFIEVYLCRAFLLSSYLIP